MVPRPLIRAALKAGAIFAGRPPTVAGQTLDREAYALVRVLERIERRATADSSPAHVRAEFERTTPMLDGPPRTMAKVIDTTVSGPVVPLPVRIYVPFGARDAVLVFFHGGGGMVGSIASHDGACRRIADRARVRVASVGYRLAPEHPFPAAVEDALAAWHWACGLGAARIAVGGDSFGGLLAASVERRARRRPDLAVLIYPWLDLRLATDSMQVFGDDYVLTRDTLAWLRDAYVPDADLVDDASPALVDDLDGAAPHVIVTSGFDPLRDEGAAYAARLTAAGARVDYRCERDLVHGFINMTGALGRGASATDQVADDLAAALVYDRRA